METSKLFEERFQRIKSAAGVTRDSELAEILEIHQGSVGAAKKRKQIPSGWIEKISEQFKVSADWLFWGRGPMRIDERRDDLQVDQLSNLKGISPDLLSSVIEIVEEVLRNAGRTLQPKKKAELIVAICDLYIDTQSEVDPVKVLRLVKSVA